MDTWSYQTISETSCFEFIKYARSIKAPRVKHKMPKTVASYPIHTSFCQTFQCAYYKISSHQTYDSVPGFISVQPHCFTLLTLKLQASLTLLENLPCIDLMSVK